MIETNEQALERWNREVGHTTGFDYLNENSRVWEIGLWHGHWASQIAKNYNPYITAFEPISSWYFEGLTFFKQNPKIILCPFGLGAADRHAIFKIDKDATGEYRPEGVEKSVFICGVDSFIAANKITNIDLVQCNCEGGEYEIVPALINSGNIRLFDNLLIQFHNLEPDSAKKMYDIQLALADTHMRGAYTDFVFEYWKRK